MSKAIRTPLFAVVCKWKDLRSAVVVNGAEVIVLEAGDANEALLAAHAARPDLWEDQGPHFYREAAVYPAEVQAALKGGGAK